MNDKNIHWDFECQKINATEYELVFIAKFPGRHLYSQFQPKKNDSLGPIPAEFKFEAHDDQYKLIGPVRELGNRIITFEPAFEINVAYFENTVTFKQRVKQLSKTEKIKVDVYAMHCSNNCSLIDFNYTFDLMNAKTPVKKKKQIKKKVQVH